MRRGRGGVRPLVGRARPDQVGFAYERALEFLAELGVDRICVFEGRERRSEPLGELADPKATAAESEATVAVRVGIGYDSHRLVEGESLILGGWRSSTSRAWRATRTPTC